MDSPGRDESGFSKLVVGLKFLGKRSFVDLRFWWVPVTRWELGPNKVGVLAKPCPALLLPLCPCPVPALQVWFYYGSLRLTCFLWWEGGRKKKKKHSRGKEGVGLVGGGGRGRWRETLHNISICSKFVPLLYFSPSLMSSSVSPSLDRRTTPRRALRTSSSTVNF